MLVIIQSNNLNIKNQVIETDSQKIQVLGLLDMSSTQEISESGDFFLSRNYKVDYMDIRTLQK